MTLSNDVQSTIDNLQKLIESPDANIQLSNDLKQLLSSFLKCYKLIQTQKKDEKFSNSFDLLKDHEKLKISSPSITFNQLLNMVERKLEEKRKNSIDIKIEEINRMEEGKLQQSQSNDSNDHPNEKRKDDNNNKHINMKEDENLLKSQPISLKKPSILDIRPSESYKSVEEERDDLTRIINQNQSDIHNLEVKLNLNESVIQELRRDLENSKRILKESEEKWHLLRTTIEDFPIAIGIDSTAAFISQLESLKKENENLKLMNESLKMENELPTKKAGSSSTETSHSPLSIIINDKDLSISGSLSEILTQLRSRRNEQEEQISQLKSKLLQLEAQLKDLNKSHFEQSHELKEAYVRLEYQDQMLHLLKEQLKENEIMDDLMNNYTDMSQKSNLKVMEKDRLKLQQVLHSYDQLMNHYVNLKNTYKSLIEYLNEQESYIAVLTSENQIALQSQNECLEENMAIKEAMNKMMEEYDQFKLVLQEEAHRWFELHRENDFLCAELEEYREKLRLLSEQIAAKDDELSAIHDTYKRYIKENDHLKQELISLRSRDTMKTTPEQSSLLRPIEKSATEDLKDQMKELEFNNSELENRIKELQFKLDRKEKQFRILENERSLHEQQRRRKENEPSSQSPSSFSVDLEQSRVDLLNQVLQLEKENEEETHLIHDLQQKLNRLRHELTLSRKQNQKLEELIADLEKRSAISTTEIPEKDRYIQHLKNQITNLKTENEALKQVIKNMERIMQENSPIDSSKETKSSYSKAVPSASSSNPLFTPTPTFVPPHPSPIPMSEGPKTSTFHSDIEDDDKQMPSLTTSILQEWKSHGDSILNQMAEFRELRKTTKNDPSLSSIEKIHNFFHQENQLLVDLIRQVQEDLQKAKHRKEKLKSNADEDRKDTFNFKEQTTY